MAGLPIQSFRSFADTSPCYMLSYIFTFHACPQSPENTVTYTVALAQFIILALVFNKGMPHRSPIWTNTWLVIALLAQVTGQSNAGYNTYLNYAMAWLVDTQPTKASFRALRLGRIRAMTD
jgi:hypothetical protein